MPEVGFECRAYRNTGAYGSPTWHEITNIKDVTLNRDRTEVDVSTRGNRGNEAIILGMKKNGIDFKMVWDPDDVDVIALMAAHDADNEDGDQSVDLLFLDDEVDEPGSQGLRAVCCVPKFTRNEPLDGAVDIDVTVKPTYVSDPTHAPYWYTVPGT